MSDMGRKSSWQSDEAVEELLGKAAPRPMPPAADTETVRNAVQAEWQKVARTRRRVTRLVSFAMAASVLIAVFAGLNLLRVNGIADVQVASIGKSFGSIFVLGENAELLQGNELGAVIAGQTLMTGADSGIGLAWGNGGSLRIDADTRVEFRSADSIYLRSGRVYFDSRPAWSGNQFSTVRAATLTIETDFGTVSHVGTQYMTAADNHKLTVSVRDGEVVIRNARSTDSAVGGQQLSIAGSGAPSKVNFRGWGEAWQWTEKVSPDATLDGRSVDEFLAWVGRETGLEVRFESELAAMHARNETLNGIVKTSPRQALQFYMLGTDLDWRIEDGVIYVSET